MLRDGERWKIAILLSGFGGCEIKVVSSGIILRIASAEGDRSHFVGWCFQLVIPKLL